ncbi:MAG: hypothetical protein D6726_06420 [Nitrospirae bacterium]|nr:MAG: hypothetical protein D6726_06420 [Nitrospirota bacterium]
MDRENREEVVNEVYLVRVYRRGEGVLTGKVEEVGKRREGSFRTEEELLRFLSRREDKGRIKQ